MIHCRVLRLRPRVGPWVERHHGFQSCCAVPEVAMGSLLVKYYQAILMNANHKQTRSRTHFSNSFASLDAKNWSSESPDRTRTHSISARSPPNPSPNLPDVGWVCRMPSSNLRQKANVFGVASRVLMMVSSCDLSFSGGTSLKKSFCWKLYPFIISALKRAQRVRSLSRRVLLSGAKSQQ